MSTQQKRGRQSWALISFIQLLLLSPTRVLVHVLWYLIYSWCGLYDHRLVGMFKFCAAFLDKSNNKVSQSTSNVLWHKSRCFVQCLSTDIPNNLLIFQTVVYIHIFIWRANTTIEACDKNFHIARHKLWHWPNIQQSRAEGKLLLRWSDSNFLTDRRSFERFNAKMFDSGSDLFLFKQPFLS